MHIPQLEIYLIPSSCCPVSALQCTGLLLVNINIICKTVCIPLFEMLQSEEVITHTNTHTQSKILP